MDIEHILDFARTHPQSVYDPSGSPSFRCAAFLKDGLYLPCVAIASEEARIDLAIRRFDETRTPSPRPWWLGGKAKGNKAHGQGFQYRDIVRTFVTSGNRVNHYDIERLEESPFAIPMERLKEVRGETRMSWTQFTAEMSDGSQHHFGTTFLFEFFQMPTGYTAKDIVKIHAHPLMAPMPEGVVYRERPHFTCYVPGFGTVSPK